MFSVKTNRSKKGHQDERNRKAAFRAKQRQTAREIADNRPDCANPERRERAKQMNRRAAHPRWRNAKGSLRGPCWDSQGRERRSRP